MDLESLKSVSLVNRDYHSQATRRLWRRFTLAVQKNSGIDPTSTPRTRLKHAINFLTAGERTQYVRDLHLHISASLGPEDDPEVRRTLIHLFSTIKRMPLRTLKVYATFHRDHVSHTLAVLHFAPDLSRLSVNFSFAGDGFASFAQIHPKLSTITWTSDDVPLVLPCKPSTFDSSTLLPIHPPSPRFRYRTPSDPILFAPGIISPYMDYIRPPATAIVHLSIRLIPYPASPVAYQCILKHLPRLRSLEVSHSPMANKEDWSIALGIIGSLQELATFIWNGGDEQGQDEFFAACSMSCRSLRMATFHWWDPFCGPASRIYSRRSQIAGWEHSDEVSDGGISLI